MAEKELPTPEEMQEMAEIDIRTVDTSSLVDIEQVQKKTNLPQEERIADYIRQIKNPYCFKCGNFVVTAKYSDKGLSIEDCLQSIII